MEVEWTDRRGIKGTVIHFVGFVPAGFADSGWSDDYIFVNAPVTRDQAIRIVKHHVRQTEVTKVLWHETTIMPFFGTNEWWMATYEARRNIIKNCVMEVISIKSVTEDITSINFWRSPMYYDETVTVPYSHEAVINMSEKQLRDITINVI